MGPDAGLECLKEEIVDGMVAPRQLSIRGFAHLNIGLQLFAAEAQYRFTLCDPVKKAHQVPAVVARSNPSSIDCRNNEMA